MDTLTVETSAGRRRFIRRGAAFLLASGVMAATRDGLTADCDQNPEGCEQGCSDSDVGEGSDPTGAGKSCSSISISAREREASDVVPVGKIRG